MTVYCYRCGGRIEVPVRVKSVEIWNTGRAEVTFDKADVKHECPQDAS